jgi:SMI1 / KNR4 family (SUKH-1)
MIVSQLREYWEERGIANSILPSRDDLAAFERQYDITLPLTIVEYFLIANGTRDGQWGMEDDDLISFWHLDQIRPFNQMYPTEAIPDGDRLFVFADWSIDAHAWAVRLSRDAAAETPVMITYDPIQDVARSFDDFLSGYLERSKWALFPEPRTPSPGQRIRRIVS